MIQWAISKPPPKPGRPQHTRQAEDRKHPLPTPSACEVAARSRTDNGAERHETGEATVDQRAFALGNPFRKRVRAARKQAGLPHAVGQSCRQ